MRTAEGAHSTSCYFAHRTMKTRCSATAEKARIWHRFIVWYKRHFDMFNRLCVYHECDRQTRRRADERTNRLKP